MEWLIIILGLLHTIFLTWNVVTKDDSNRYFSAILLLISTIMIVIILLSYENRNTPTALDVYKDKTTLEITYRDSIPVDSVVVWKPEFKKQ